MSAAQRGLFDEPDELFDEAAVERMKSEGFYGQADVRIRDVSERLEAAHRRFGSPEQIRRFIQLGLRQYGCSVEPRADGTLRIQVNNPRLRVAGLPNVFEKVVLDPEERQLHPDATILDVGHPLIRRLNAVIREDALRQSEGGARTAAYSVPGQRGTLLVGHGLLRATASTTPPTLLEEVVTFGVRAGVAGIQPLPPEGAAEAAAREPSARAVERSAALATLARLYQDRTWQAAQQQAVRRALDGLREHRAAMKAELAQSGAERADWLQGFDDVQEVGFDLYCLTLLLPEGV